MDTSSKSQPRKRLIVGWRQVARRVTENRVRQSPPPPTPRAQGR